MRARSLPVGTRIALIALAALACGEALYAQDPAAATAARKPPPDSKRAAALLAEGRPAPAARMCERLIQRDAGDFGAWYVLAQCHTSDWPLRSDERGEEAAERCVEIKGRDPQLLMILATARLRQGRFDQAMQLADEILAMPILQGN